MLSLFAYDEIGASDTEVTVYFVVIAVSGLAAMLVTGRLSDRGQGRRLMIVASLCWLAIGYWVLSAVESYPAMLATGVVFFSVVGVPTAQLLAYAREVIQRGGDDAASIAVIGLVRVVFSIGSFLGFAAGGLGLASVGSRSVFRVTGVLLIACVLLSRFALRQLASPEEAGTRRATTPPVPEHTATKTGQRLLVLFAVLMVLFSSGRVMQLAQLPILLRESLHAPLQLVGFALAVPPLCELALMPLMAWAALRLGRGRVFLLGAVASVVYYVGLVVVDGPWQLLLLQVDYAVFGAATVMVGIDLAQRLLRHQAGLATSLYLSHENVATINGSLVATVSVATLGHQTGFLVPGALCLIAVGVTVGVFLRHPVSFDLRTRRAGRLSRAAPT